MQSEAIRSAAERDFPLIARMQQLCPEAAQWPVGDYSGTNILMTDEGFCCWRQISEDEAELLNLAVPPASRRKGVASALLKELRRKAGGTIFLEVAEDNTAAIALYRKLGWERVSIRRGYYSGGARNAIVMKNSSW